MQSASAFQFCFADLEVALSSNRDDVAASLIGHYSDYPSRGTAADLRLSIEEIVGFSRGEPAPHHPAFDSEVSGRTVRLLRCDAEGAIELPAHTNDPITGHFRVSRQENVVEAAIRVGSSIALSRRNGLILHASAVKTRDGGVLAFAGVSGAGKSTIAALLAPMDGVTQFSEELLVVKRSPSGWRAYVSPFVGSRGLDHGDSAPLVGIHFLRQAPHNRRSQRSAIASIPELLRHTLIYGSDPDTAQSALDLATDLTHAVPCYTLAFEKSPRVASVLELAC